MQGTVKTIEIQTRLCLIENRCPVDTLWAEDGVVGERIMVSKNRSWQDRWQPLWPVTFARLVGPIRIPQLGSGYLDTKGSFTGDRRTQLTPLVNIMTHTTFTQRNLSLSSAVVNPVFCIMNKRAGELPLHRQARSERQFIAQREKLATRMLTWTITQHIHQNTKLEATPSVKSCVSTILEDKTTHQARDNWKLEDHQVPTDPVATEDLWRKRHKGVPRYRQEFQAAERGEARIVSSRI